MAEVTTTVAEVEAKPAAKAKAKVVERLSKLVPDKVHTWPYLVRLEMLVGTIVMARVAGSSELSEELLAAGREAVLGGAPPPKVASRRKPAKASRNALAAA